ncbi:MAG: hypothetical protein IKH01_05980 [Prevotella sp.]|nr:hypothetical protein [Prevotella sp.]
MKKFYLLFAALFTWTVVATAGIKNLYKQDFESAATPADAGWKSPNLAGNMSMQSTEYGTWFRFNLGANNNRNAVLDFNYGRGTGIFEGQDVKEYTVKFQWGLIRNPNDAAKPQDVQFSTELALLGGNWDSNLKSKGYFINNGQYATADSLCLFSITQLKGAYSDTNPYWIDNQDVSSHAFEFVIDRDTTNATITLAEGMWYDIEVTINTETKQTKWKISELEGAEIKSGESKLADNCDPFVKGLNVLLGRRNSVADIDEVKVQAITEGDYANTPTISLVEVDMKKRTFDIYFEEGEILHVKKTEGVEDTAVESPYRYVTETSGTLEVWTEAGTATSEHVTYDVVAEIIPLPAAAIEVIKVSEGFGKSMKMTVDNTSVPTQPNITLTWEYSNGDKSTGEVASGAVYAAETQGTLTVTTHAYGFGETTVTFENNTEFAIDQTIDLQHLSEADLIAKGFTEIDPLQSASTSGETNWTGRKRLWFGIENGEFNEDQTPKYDTYVVYGPEAASEIVEPIRRFYLKPSTLTKEVATTIFAPMYTWYTGQADPAVADGSDVAGLKVNYNIGLINTGTKTDEGTSINYANGNIGIDGLTADDFYMVYLICDYGTTSEHPIFPQGTKPAEAKEQYLAMNLGTAVANANQQINGVAAKDGQAIVLKGTDIFGLYRIDTAITRIDIFKSKNPSGIETLPYNKVVSDHNAPIYNLNGVQVTTLQKGIYIKQGKKFIVR